MISAIILAAGQSKRMGKPKLLLPWGNTTVLGKIIETIKHADIEDILVVTGGARDEVEQIASQYGSRMIYNNNYGEGEMLSSVQLGLKEQKPETRATLICLGDQPQIEEGCVRTLVKTYHKNQSDIIVPSYQMRRGHPWLLGHVLWKDVFQMHPPESMRNFLDTHKNNILYVQFDSPSVLLDLDTPEDYLKYKP